MAPEPTLYVKTHDFKTNEQPDSLNTTVENVDEHEDEHVNENEKNEHENENEKKKQRNEDSIKILQPTSTLNIQSWQDFSAKFRDAINGKMSTIENMHAKLDSPAVLKAASFFNELSFVDTTESDDFQDSFEYHHEPTSTNDTEQQKQRQGAIEQQKNMIDSMEQSMERCMVQNYLWIAESID